MNEKNRIQRDFFYFLDNPDWAFARKEYKKKNTINQMKTQKKIKKQMFDKLWTKIHCAFHDQKD